jgi:hypothetical protein
MFIDRTIMNFASTIFNRLAALCVFALCLAQAEAARAQDMMNQVDLSSPCLRPPK